MLYGSHPMTSRIEFLFDFGSPNAYLVHKALPQFEARLATRVVYVPILLGGLFKLTGNQAPIAAFAHVPSKLAYERREMERFIASHALEQFKWNPHFPVNTLHLMRGVVAAYELGIAPAYIDAMFAAMWERGLKMDDPNVIGEALATAGLPAAEIVAKTQEQPVKDALTAATSDAHARGAFGSPTFFVGDEMYFGKERLAAVEAEFLRVRGR